MDLRWAIPGEIATGSLPRNQEDVAFLKRTGIRAVLSLHRLPLGLSERLAEQDIAHVNTILEDMASPPGELMDGICALLEQWRREGRPALVHCYAGVGRCMTAVAAYLAVRLGSADEAFELAGHPETRAQQDFVREYARSRQQP